MSTDRATRAQARRSAREREIIATTRQLFDERGLRDAQIADISRATGLNRAILYRHFLGKEELVALVLVDYLEELRVALLGALETVGPEASARTRLEALSDAFSDYGLAHPAFVDSAQSLMLRTRDELFADLREDARTRLGIAMNGCLTVTADVLSFGTETGDFRVSEPVLTANTMYALGLGALQLARVGVQVRELSPGVPGVGQVTAEHVRSTLHTTFRALAEGRDQPVRPEGQEPPQ